jgi:hypothetical protein
MDPISLGAAALSTIGGILNRNSDAKRERKAREAAAAQARAELGRQTGFSNTAFANLGDTVSGITDPAARLNAAAAIREQQLGDIVASLGTPGLNVRMDAPDIVKRGFDAERASADTHVAQRNTSLARTGGLGDIMRGDVEAALNLASKNNVIGDTARRSLNVNQIEQTGAYNTANRRPAITLGDILQIGGAGLGAYGMFAPATAGANVAGKIGHLQLRVR